MNLSDYWNPQADKDALRKAVPEPKTRVKTCLCRVGDSRECIERRQPQAAREDERRRCECECHVH